MIGTGYFSRFHYDAWARIDEVQLAALATRDEKTGEEMAGAYEIDRVYSDIGEMLATERLDILDIVAPPAVHLEACKLAADAGVAAICQKPFCGDLETARAATRHARDAGTLLVVHENFRFQPWHQEISRQIRQGALGNLFQATFRLRPGDGQGADAYLDRQPYFQKMTRFLIHETAIHLVDVFRFLFGEIISVTADLRRLNPDISGEDAGLIVFEHADGLRSVFDGNRLSDHPSANTRLTMGEMLVEGSAGVISLDGDGRLSFRAHGQFEGRPIDYDWQDRSFGGDCVYRLQRHVVDHLTNGTPLMNAAQDYLRNQEIEEAVYLSASEGRRVKV